MDPVHRLLGLLALLLVLAAGLGAVLGVGGCSIRGLDEPRATLSPAEEELVSGQVDRAIEEEEWQDAWNQAVDAGLSRTRLEAIALGAVAARDSIGESMMDELRAEYGGLTEDGRKKALAVSEELSGAGKWKAAARVIVLSADDAPAYAHAWDLYDAAPPKKAAAVLEVILEARAEAAESADREEEQE